MPESALSAAATAAEKASAAFPAWSALGPNERRRRLLRAADLLDSRAPDFATLVARETHAAPGWGFFNVMLASSMLREAASMTTQVSGETIPSDVPGSFAFSIRQPVGVVLAIAPWNAPVILGVRALAVPLACGNTVVLKASENCPETHKLIGAILEEAGLGENVVTVVTNAPEDAPAVVAALIAHPAIRRINFTGSTRVGRIIAGLAAAQLKPVVLELGGKAPLLILEDADLDEAVNAAAFGSFVNAGQVCMSTDRILVDQTIADTFTAKLAAKVGAIPPGALGGVINAAAFHHARELADEALEQGATLALDGENIILDHVTPDMAIFREETFGPSVSITRFKDVEEAIRLANDTEYGLSAAVFTRDIALGLEVAKRLDSGICHINAPTVHDEAQMPFGGTKASGYGRFGGRAAIHEFTELRWITIQTTPRHYPF